MIGVMRGDPKAQIISVRDAEGQPVDQTVMITPDLTDRVKAAKELLDRGMGRPTAKKEVTHSINAEHLAALKHLAKAVDVSNERDKEREAIIDITPEPGGDRAKLAYADAKR